MTAILGLALVAASKIAVVVVGDDPAASGDLQAALESRLAGADLLTADALAAKIGVDVPAPEDPATRKAVRALLDEAAKAYYDDRYEELLAMLAKADAMSHVAAEKVEIHLWRLAAFQAFGDPRGAANQARLALVLAPDLAVDVALFPPTVKDLIEKTRQETKRVRVTVEGTPAGAVVKIDDRLAGTELEVPSGRHQLVVSSPGRRRVSRTVEVGETALRVAVHLPLALEAGAAEAAARDVWRGGPASTRDTLAEKAGADVLVFAIAKPDGIRAVVWWKEDGRYSASARRAADAAKVLGDWIAGEIAAGRPSLRDAAWRVSASAGLATSMRSLQVEGAGGNGYDAAFAGTGPAASLRVARGSFFSEAGAGAVSYAMSSVKVDAPGAGDRASGGSALASHLAFGYTRNLGTPGEEQDSSVSASLGVAAESLTAQDASGAAGPLGLFPSHRTLYPEVRVAAAKRLSLAGRTGLAEAAIGGSPFGVWREDPRGTSGTSPTVMSLGVEAGFSWKTPRRWLVSLGYRAFLRSVSFDGEARAPVEPALRAEKRTEQVQTLQLTIGRGL